MTYYKVLTIDRDRVPSHIIDVAEQEFRMQRPGDTRTRNEVLRDMLVAMLDYDIGVFMDDFEVFRLTRDRM